MSIITKKKINEVGRGLINEVGRGLINGIYKTPCDVAQTLYLMYRYMYTCTSLIHNTWYELRNNKWYEINSDISLRQKISKELVLEYTRFRRFCYKMAESEMNGELPEDCEYDIIENENVKKISEEEWLKMASICNDVVINLNTKSYKDALLKEAKELFFNEKLNKELNDLKSINSSFEITK